MPNPVAPLGHHWQDATHIVFGTVTAALLTTRLKVEKSWFNGREPHERRFDIEVRRFDSYAGRLSYNPTPNWALQTSYAFLKSPESLSPNESLHQLTVSALSHVPLARGFWATTAVWGRNLSSSENTNSYLLESAWTITTRHEPFLRVEHVEKSGHDLALPPPADAQTFSITSLSLGCVLRFLAWQGLDPDLGLQMMLYRLPMKLTQFYASRFAAGGMLYLNLRPQRMDTSRHKFFTNRPYTD